MTKLILLFFLQPLAASVLSLLTQLIDIELDLDTVTSLLRNLLLDTYDVLNLNILQ